MEHQKNFDNNPKEKEFVEKLVTLNRTCKTVKGGRRMSFSALTVVGDQKGRIGYGLGKADDVCGAIKKGIDKAKRNLISMSLKNGNLSAKINPAAISNTTNKSVITILIVLPLFFILFISLRSLLIFIFSRPNFFESLLTSFTRDKRLSYFSPSILHIFSMILTSSFSFVLLSIAVLSN